MQGVGTLKLFGEKDTGENRGDLKKSLKYPYFQGTSKVLLLLIEIKEISDSMRMIVRM